MTGLKALVRAYLTSGADTTEPAKLVLGELWDQVLPPTGQEELIVDALYDALKGESDGSEPVWSRKDLRRILDIDFGQVNLETLDNGSLARILKESFSRSEVALVPSRTLSTHDFEQLADNVIRRTFIKFDEKLQLPENQALRDKLIRDYSRRTGVSVARVTQEFMVVEKRIGAIESDVNEIGNKVTSVSAKMDEVSELLNSIKDTRTNLRSRKSTSSPSTQKTSLSAVERKSLLTRLDDLETSARILAELRDEYVLSTDFPPQARKSLLDLQKRINVVRRQAGLPKKKF